jgi:hypothetical protein
VSSKLFLLVDIKTNNKITQTMNRFRIDIRELEFFGENSAMHLAGLIGSTCQADDEKRYMSYLAVNDFEWCDDGTAMYYIAGVMTDSVFRADGHISSAEWLCGVFNSGELLSEEHVRIIMNYVNEKSTHKEVGDGSYTSGKETWRHVPQPLKFILDVLDDAAVANQPVSVVCPEIVPNVGLTEADLQKMELNRVSEHCTIKWIE